VSGTFPTSPGFRAINMRSINLNYRSESVSGRTQVRNRGGQKWAFTASFPQLTRAEFGPVSAFIANQDGAFETFQITLPVLSTMRGSVTGTGLVNGATGLGATTIPVDGFTGTLKAGDFVKFGHTKVYMLTADKTDAGNITIKPPLVATIANNETFIYTAVPFTVRLDNDVQEWGASPGPFFNYEIDFTEVT